MNPLRRFLLASDTHFAGTRPVSRKDPDWIASQEKTLGFLVDRANEHGVPLVLTGDVLDHARVATEIVNMVLRGFQRALHGVFLIPGNHELLFHRWEDVERSSIGIILKSYPLIPQIDGIQDAAPFGQDRDTGASVVFTHQLVFRDEKSKPGKAVGHTAQSLLDSLPSAKWIFTGDYHDSYWHRSPDGRNVVNPGCTMVHNAAKLGDVCRCALVDLDAESVEWIEIPDDPSMVSDAHLRTVEAKESRVEAFLERVKGAGAVVLDFRANLDAVLQTLDKESRTYKALVRIKDRAQEVEK
jgi:DNA repair exonuclease SbcCD nuclease subunit